MNETLALEIDRLGVAYGGQTVLDGLSLALPRGEIACLLGPSGCGKTTVLRAIAGFARVGAGVIRVNGVEVSTPSHHTPPEQRGLGMVFQDYALFPHLDVAGNVAFGLSSLAPAERRARVQEMLDLVGLSELASRFPHQLSGGQQQRVAIARAVVSDPKLLLCDEPTGDLDRATADEILKMLSLLNAEFGKTIVMVTHDPEAAKYAKRVLHLDKGRFVGEELAA